MNQAQTESEIEEMVGILLAAPFGRRDRYVEFGLFGWAGGKANTVAPSATAYPHRATTTMLRAGAIWDFAVPLVDQIALNDWLDKAYDFLKRVGLPASYQNRPNERITDWPTAYYGENLKRLITDPHSPDDAVICCDFVAIQI